MTMQNQRLYVVVNGALRHGQITAQSIHAVAEFAVRDTDAFLDWTANGNTIVVLQTRGVWDLVQLREKASTENFEFYQFHEPDLGDQLTAIAFRPAENVQDFLKDFPVAHSVEKKAQKPSHHLPRVKIHIEK